MCSPAPGEDAPDREDGIVTGGGTVGEERPILQGESALRDCLDSVARAPRAVALFCDIDGMISPIASRPANAFVPARFGELLRALVDKLGSVAFVTGFEAIHRWAEEEARRTACAVAAVTKETPRPVLDEADVRVAATGGVHEVLRRLLAAAGG